MCVVQNDETGRRIARRRRIEASPSVPGTPVYHNSGFGHDVINIPQEVLGQGIESTKAYIQKNILLDKQVTFATASMVSRNDRAARRSRHLFVSNFETRTLRAPAAAAAVCPVRVLYVLQ